jgi:hypothetical protein
MMDVFVDVVDDEDEDEDEDEGEDVDDMRVKEIVMVNVIVDGIESWREMMMVSIVVVVLDDIAGRGGMYEFDVDWDDGMDWDRIMMGFVVDDEDDIEK